MDGRKVSRVPFVSLPPEPPIIRVLSGDLEIDVAVIGAGVAGLTAALA